MSADGGYENSRSRTRADETMSRAVAVFAGRAVQGACLMGCSAPFHSQRPRRPE